MRIVMVDPSRAIQRAMTELIVPGEHEVLAFSEGQKHWTALAQTMAFEPLSPVFNSQIFLESNSAQLPASWLVLVVRSLLLLCHRRKIMG